MNPMYVRRFVCGLLISGMCFVNAAAPGQTTKSFSGQWVLRLGDRNFMVLTLAPGDGASGAVAGALLRPEEYGTSNGELFFQIGKNPLREPIIHSDLRAGVLSITVQNPNSPTDHDRYRISLLNRNHAAVTYDGRIMDPWPFTKQDGAVTLATDWEVDRTYTFDDSDVPNAEMTQIFQADQKVRLQDVRKLADSEIAAMFKADAEL